MLESVYASLFQNAISRLSLSDSVATLQAAGIDGGYNWLLEAQILEALRSNGIQKTILHSKANIKDSLVEITYRPIKQNIIYKKFDSKRIARTVSVELHLRVTSENCELLLSKIFKAAGADTLHRNKIGLIENSNLEFTHGYMKKSLASRMVQPVVVSLVTGFIIYLFYSYRSK